MKMVYSSEREKDTFIGKERGFQMTLEGVGGGGDISQRLYLLIELSFSKSLECNSCDVD